MQLQNKQIAISALNQVHTDIHRLIDRTKNDANRDLIKSDLARTIAIAVNTLSIL